MQIRYTVTSMEFEANKASNSPDISDAQRLAASGKHITLNPIHTFTHSEPAIRPREDVPTTMQLSNPKVYIASESEDTSTIHAAKPITEIAGLPTHPISRTGVIVAIVLFVAVIGTTLFFMLIY